MEETMECRRKTLRYALPIVGAAIPIAVKLVRRAGCGAREESKQEMLLRESNLDLHDALKAALKHISGTPVEVELEEEHDIPVWQVQIVPKKGGATRKVVVDAKTGNILEMSAEFPAARVPAAFA